MRIFFCFFFVYFNLIAGERLADKQWNFLADYCIDCHDEEINKGNINFDVDLVDWQDPKVRHKWTDAYSMLKRGKMPPKKKKKQPNSNDKQAFMAWLDKKLVEVSPIGGTPVHRLNQREYLNTIRSIFGIDNFKLPLSFPQDISSHGFDTMAEELVISPSHVEAYHETALKVADYLFPPLKKKTPKQSWTIPANDLTISYSSAYLVDGAMRLASTGQKVRNGTWPTKFEAPASGLYKIKIDLSHFNIPKEHTPILELKSHKTGRNSKERLLTEFPIKNHQAKSFEVEVDLYKGENLLLLYKNAFFNYSDKEKFVDILKDIFNKDPRLAAAWFDVNNVPRGGIGWARVKKAYQKQDLDTSKLTPNSDELNDFIVKVVGKNTVLTGETLVYKYFEEGPNIGIHNIQVEGPFTSIDDPETIAQQNLTKKFVGRDKLTDVDLNVFLKKYLSLVFRRPATNSEIKTYQQLVEQEVKRGQRLEEGFHLAIRTSLASPHFLYRENGNGKLTQYELASRLSYFLTSNPPKGQLKLLAEQQKLNNSEVLLEQAQQFLKSAQHRKYFINDFTSQWLDTDQLKTIMPDNSVFKRFRKEHSNYMINEVTSTFNEILVNNLSLSEFIDPDFIFTNDIIGKEIYQLAKIDKKSKSRKIVKFAIDRGSKKGGLLSMPAVMMATANGVDTQPVLRGVWMLENILGTPPPAPPKNVPALPPDTADAIGPRAKLEAHKNSEACASCHEDIDPMGFVLENFDPVGRWREEYPAKGTFKALKIDSKGTMPNGTKLNDVRDLKKYLIDHPEYFSNCLAEKLMVYATGREMNYHEKKIIEHIVEENIKSGNRFKDLILKLIDSEIFKAR